MRIEQISSRQLTWLIITVNIATSTVVVPGMVIFSAQQNAWLSYLIAILLSICGLMINLSLMKRFPRQTVAQFAQTLLGPWLGKFVGIFYGLVFLSVAAICIRLITGLILTTTLQETPLWPLVLGFTIAIIYGAWLGIEPISRVNDLVLPLSTGFAVILFLFALPDGKLYQALPVLQFDFKGILTSVIPSTSCLGEVFFILMVSPAINKPEELKSASLKGLLISWGILTLTTQGIIFLLGIYRASTYLFPLMRVSAELHILDFLERLEPLVLTVWLLVNGVKICVFTYCFLVSTTQSLGLKNYSPALIIAAIVLPIVSLIPKNFAELMTIWIGLVAFKIIIPTAFFLIPGLLLIIAKVKRQYG